MSNTRLSSVSSASASWNFGSCQPRAWRVGASRLPSRPDLFGPSDTVFPFTQRAPRGARSHHNAPLGRSAGLQVIQRLLEAIRVRPFRLGEGLEPIGDLVEAFLSGALRHARVHIRVLVGLAGDGRLAILCGGADRQTGGRIT